MVPLPFVVDQNPPNAPVVVASSATLPLAHEVPPLVNEMVGVVFTVTTTESCEEHPFAPVPITVYVVVAVGLTEIDAVVAVVIGGASLSGGKGTAMGTVIGAIIIGALEIGLVNLSVPTYNLHIAVGCILIFAVLIDQFSPELIQNEGEI